jgi:YidC/Oxa1 family membrane protein insertase
MDTRRLILAIALSFLVLLGYNLLFVKKAPETQLPAGQSTQIETGPAKQAPEEKTAPISAPAGVQKNESKSLILNKITSGGIEEIKVSTSLYEATWSNKGGVLTSWKLRKHKDEKKGDLDLVAKASKENGVFPFSLQDESAQAAKNGITGISSNVYNSPFYKVTNSGLDIKDGEKAELKFQFSDGKEVEVEKIFTFYGGKYEFDVAVTVRKNGQSVEPRVLWGPGIGSTNEAEMKQRFGGGGGASVLASGKVFRLNENAKNYKPEASAFNFVNWAAYDDNYFAALLVPAGESGTAAFLKQEGTPVSFYLLSVSNPGKAFVGPKEYDKLSEFGHNAKKIVRFGFFGFFSEILFYAIKFIYKSIPNWGFAIIILTLIIKVLFFPLTISQTKSQAKMMELQPKLKSIKAKYKKAKTDIAQRRAMQEETMKLYKEHGVNPAGGCLPLLIQIPFFFGLFSMLRVVIEFRQSPWILWIRDLSAHDPFYVTPILVGITQFISQKMTPTAGDPSQQRMMLMMPVIMTFLFLQLQSGLVLYMLTQNVLQIVQQYIMNRTMLSKKSVSHGQRRKN